MVMVVAVVAGVGCSESDSANDQTPYESSTAEAPGEREQLAANFSDPRRNPAIPSTVPDATLARSPIEEALGFVVDPEQLSRMWEDQATKRSEHITQCVRNEGYRDFVNEEGPPLPSPADFVSSVNDSLTSIGIEDFAYGVTLSLRGTWSTIYDDEPQIDRNSPIAQFRARFNEDEWQAFMRNAYGPCHLEASDLYPNPVDSMPAGIAQEIATLRNTTLATSSEVEAAQNTWIDCMQQNGFDVISRDEARALVDAETADTLTFLHQFLGTGVVPSSDDASEFERMVAPVEEYERLVAETDLGCATEANEAEIRTRVLWEAEEAWLEENEDRIALLLAEQESPDATPTTAEP